MYVTASSSYGIPKLSTQWKMRLLVDNTGDISLTVIADWGVGSKKHHGHNCPYNNSQLLLPHNYGLVVS